MKGFDPLQMLTSIFVFIFTGVLPVFWMCVCVSTVFYCDLKSICNIYHKFHYFFGESNKHKNTKCTSVQKAIYL